MDTSVRPRLETDLKQAMRSGDTVARDAIRYILAAVKNAEIDARGGSKAVDETAALWKLGKQFADAQEQFRAAGRDDLADREAVQLEVLQRYLPEEMGDAELAATADAVVAETAATGPQDMGKVMPVLLARLAGRADGRRVSAAAK
ncbi:MAG: GatB/YqeY domain-containing protein, partial [Chloroflexia bacterium]|nr:GatB/YqeY domain-containing protein [Chloroflexia bacterium]